MALSVLASHDHLSVNDQVEGEEEHSEEGEKKVHRWSKGNSDKTGHKEDHAKGVHDGATAGEVILGSNSVNGKSNDCSSS